MHRPGRGSSSLSLNIGRHRRGDVRWRLQLQRSSDSYNYQRQTNDSALAPCTHQTPGQASSHRQLMAAPSTADTPAELTTRDDSPGGIHYTLQPEVTTRFLQGASAHTHINKYANIRDAAMPHASTRCSPACHSRVRSLQSCTRRRMRANASSALSRRNRSTRSSNAC